MQHIAITPRSNIAHGLRTLALAYAALFGAQAIAETPASPQTPAERIQVATGSIINKLKGTTIEQRDFVFVKSLVTTHILPIIDQKKVAKLALGKNWKKASAAQRSQFIETFRDLQIKTYTGAFRAFNGQSFEFQPTKYNKTKKKAVVVANLLQPGGKPVPIAFRLYKSKKTQDWKIYDATVAGIGLVKTYRDQLGQQLRNSTLDEIIASMREQIKEPEQPKTTKLASEA